MAKRDKKKNVDDDDANKASEDFVPLMADDDGQRKDGDKKKKKEKNVLRKKLFVHGLPKEWDEQKIEDFFSDVGPIRRTLLIRDKQGQSQGFAFVSFALPQHAAQAIRDFDGKKPAGGAKVLRIELAKPSERRKKGDNNDDDDEAAKKPAAAAAAAAAKPKPRLFFKQELFDRTVLVGSLPQTVSLRRLRRHAAQQGKIVELVYPDKSTLVEAADGSVVVMQTARICYSTGEEAERAVGYFHGRALSKKKPVSPATAYLMSEGRRCRLIVRNIPFHATVDDLRSHFGSVGHVVDAVIPTKPDGRKFGFAFVQYSRKAESKQAVETFNGKLWRDRVVVVDFALPKDKYLALKSNSAAALSVEAASKASTASKVSSKSKQTATKDDSDDDDEDYQPSEEEDDDDDDQPDEDDQPDDDDQADENDRADEDDDKKSAGDKQKKTFQDIPGASLFVRNLSLDTTEEDLKKELSKYAVVKKVLLVRDRTTGLPRGTAFVHFYSADDATKVLQTVVEEPEAAPAQSRKRSAKAKLPTETGSTNILLDGRRLCIFSAMDRASLNQAVEERKQTKVSDPRNLFLAKEGYIDPDSPAARGISDRDMKQRQHLWTQKRRALQNVNIFVSKVRLVVSNMPQHVDEKSLKQLALEQTRQALIMAGTPAKTVRKTVKIVQVKIPRHADVLGDDGDVKAGGKAKGFGFIEFAEHEHALACLRILNNNPDVWTKQQRPIVEFALVDHLAMQKLQRLREKLQKANALRKQIAPAEPKKKKLQRWQKRQLRKQRARLGLPPVEETNASKESAPVETVRQQKQKQLQERRQQIKERQKEQAQAPKAPVSAKREKPELVVPEEDFDDALLEFGETAELVRSRGRPAKKQRIENHAQLEKELLALRQRLLNEDKRALSSVYYQ